MGHLSGLADTSLALPHGREAMGFLLVVCGENGSGQSVIEGFVSGLIVSGASASPNTTPRLVELVKVLGRWGAPGAEKQKLINKTKTNHSKVLSNIKKPKNKIKTKQLNKSKKIK